MLITPDTRRRFMSALGNLGLGGTLLPGALLAQVQQSTDARVTAAMLANALSVAGLNISDDDQRAMLQAVNRNLNSYDEVRKVAISNDVAPPSYFSPITPGMKVNRTREPLRFSTPNVKRPPNLEDVAYWPILSLAHLIRTKQVTSSELTEMYLSRLHRHNEKLNCVVTFLDELARLQAREADQEIAAGKYRGPLHGIPWGAKDIIAVKGYKTTWGSGAFQDQVLPDDASVVEMLREAGAVLLGKLATHEFAHGGPSFDLPWPPARNPWNLEHFTGGSSSGSGAAVAAGLVPFALGSDTGGS
ncbi:MAG TPA: amidase, partial [Candidatus Solibacter sp.]|nr:amidase [Candidatus Solibacter sp.]